MTTDDIRKLADDPCIRECCPQAPDLLRALADVVEAAKNWLAFGTAGDAKQLYEALARLEAIK